MFECTGWSWLAQRWRSEKVSFSESNNHKAVRLLNAGFIINEGDKTAMLIMLPPINIEALLETSNFLLRLALSLVHIPAPLAPRAFFPKAKRNNIDNLSMVGSDSFDK